ncbi:hypothetical protein D0C36_24355 [Mucilaginibacter conchicola]|uniref:EcxA zinc-binding domain-containing protein n=2 Tax=Mucilaginibacter conchicola TaxID=2303333 RepID=A0A372NLP1_9SPHI|nr:hypothetical protein D0C36_24355 [Mucilaginibacter conchicola]
MKFDPRAQTEDLGDDPVKASRYGIKNLQYILPRLPQWTAEEGNNNRNLTEAYDALKGQYAAYLNHVLKYVGAYYRNNTKEGQQDAVFVAEPLQLQQDVLRFFDDELFKTPNWLLDREVLKKISGTSYVGSPLPEAVTPLAHLQMIQGDVIGRLLDIKTLANLRSNMERFGKAAYPVEEYIKTIHRYVWTELTGNGLKKEDDARRNLQKLYLRSIAKALKVKEQADDIENDAASILRADIVHLSAQLKSAIPQTKDTLTLVHFQDMQLRASKILDDDK